MLQNSHNTKVRYNQENIALDLSKKMVFLSGPRQAGKTTLAKNLSKHWAQITYLNYDSSKDRRIIIDETWDRKSDLIIFDEIAKYKKWRNKIKGIYDTEDNRPRLLITGSARLNILRKGGDSLIGRYFHHRLYPFSMKEVASSEKEKVEALSAMMKFGSFPEPFLGQNEDDANRWRKEYLAQVLTQDVVTMEDVKDLSAMELLVDRLRRSVGSTISYNSIARDLEISPKTVKRYVDILERMYLIFRVTPYHRNIARAILKEPKVYFFDLGLVEGNPGARYENLIALHLLKHLHFLEDTKGCKTALHYIRDKQGHEVDFYYETDRKGDKPMLIEVKFADQPIPRNLLYFQTHLKLNATQVTYKATRALQHGSIRSTTATDFLSQLAC